MRLRFLRPHLPSKLATSTSEYELNSNRTEQGKTCKLYKMNRDGGRGGKEREKRAREREREREREIYSNY